MTTNSNLPAGYELRDGCWNCRHCFVEWDPETWEGYCNKDEPKRPPDAPEGSTWREEEPFREAILRWWIDHKRDVKPYGHCPEHDTRGARKMDIESKSPRELIDECNGLAREFYAAHGYEVPEGYRFDEAHHPQERQMWFMALLAFERLTGTDMEDVLIELEDEDN